MLMLKVWRLVRWCRWQLAQSLLAQILRLSAPCRASSCWAGACNWPCRHSDRRRPGKRCWKRRISSSRPSALASRVARLRLLWYSSSRAALACCRLRVLCCTWVSRVRWDCSMVSAMALKLVASSPSSSSDW
ncbi:hypothetical protein D9M71_515510 [compost metagenome]